MISAIHADATKRNRTFILTGDFNARVGRRKDNIDDDCTHDAEKRTIGNYGQSGCNQRGAWLRSWACTRKVSIANTMFCKRPQHVFTYTRPGSKNTQTQIDYILVDQRARHLILDAFASPTPDLGSDHQA
eukprot:9466303-Pyramimonas_sp.AAC.1